MVPGTWDQDPDQGTGESGRGGDDRSQHDSE
jgi:hypothetical protein